MPELLLDFPINRDVRVLVTTLVVTADGQLTVTIPIGEGIRFFRLIAP